jgi:serine/threonine protein kinase/Tfp pilus assembly protein PilF
MNLTEIPLHTATPTHPSPKSNDGEAPGIERDWHRQFLASIRGDLSGHELEEAAQSYSQHCLRRLEQDAEALDSWYRSTGGSEGAQLLRNLHLSDPSTARQFARAVSNLPAAGTSFLNFRLIKELGKGAFGRVYLAEQGDLANRIVALKVSTDIFAESQTLAQLQHTNIVPIYSIHHADSFQAVCMPYFGATTLADVLQEIGNEASLPASGKVVVSTVNARKGSTLVGGAPIPSLPERDRPAAPSSEVLLTPGRSQADTDDRLLTLKMLEGFTYVEAILWIGSRLADGLAHAHERGIVHCDLKPANVLLTDEGQPMLLDFNLSSDTKPRAPAAAASIGGTLPYMSPEHLEAFRGGNERIDARSDVYSLGIILYELLAGKHPFPTRGAPNDRVLEQMIAERRRDSPELRSKNPAVSPAAESIIRKCLEPDPARRYQSARELHDDMERQLHHLPLKCAAEPSLRERVSKWRRRHPRLASFTSIGIVAAALIAALAIGFVIQGERVARHQAKDDLDRFHDQFRTAQFFLCPRNLGREQLEQGLRACRSALDQYQVVENAEWQKLPDVRRLDRDEQERLCEEVGELFILLAHGTALEAGYQADPVERQARFTLAMSFNTMAESRAGGPASGPLLLQRADLSEYLGLFADAETLREKAKTCPARTVRDLYLTAREHEKQGRYREALPLLEEATRRDPQNFAAWFVLGDCHEALSHDSEAAACFCACIALRPTFHGSWYNRGLVYIKQRLYEPGRADFDQAVTLRPEFPDSYINRALAKEGLKDFKGAVQDLTVALERGTPRTRVYFMRAYAREHAGDIAGAKVDAQEGLRLQPTDEKSWIARAFAHMDSDPQGALADLEKALELNPRSIDALQNKAHVLGERLHRTEDAIRILNKAIELHPDHVPLRAGRGILLARLGKHGAAMNDAKESLTRDTKPPNLYQVAGIYALCSKDNPENRLYALQLLSSALKSGFGLDLVAEDSDLDPIRKDPAFQRVIDAAKALHAPQEKRQ